MAARTTFMGLVALTIALILIITVQPAHAAGPNVSVGITPPVYINKDYNIQIILDDPDNGSIGKPISLSVSGPGTGCSISPSAVTTGPDGRASATLHTSSVPGYNNIIATYNGIVITIPVLVNGPPYSLSLSVNPAVRLANGVNTVKATARLADQSNYPVCGEPVEFTVGSSVKTAVTGSDGNAVIDVGPYTTAQAVNVAARSGSLTGETRTVLFLDRNNLKLNYPGSRPIGSHVEVVATFYLDLNNEVPAAGVPLNFKAWGPDNAILKTYSGTTDASGIVKFDFDMSMKAGGNIVTINNSDLDPYGPVASATIWGENGNLSRIILSSDPTSPVLADGVTGYRLSIKAVDDGGNAVKYKVLEVSKDGTWVCNVTTDPKGYAYVDVQPSKYVCAHSYTVNSSSINSTITLSFIAGPPVRVIARANPYVVASADVIDPPDSPFDVHETDVIGMVVDEWGHPLPGQSISFTSLNTSLGNITGPASGVTLGCGEFSTKFMLGAHTNGSNITTGAPVEVRSGSLSTICNVLYTNESFISVRSSINPKDNVAVNDTLNVGISVSGIGWKIRPQPLDVMLIFDRSGSMDWYSTTIFPESGTPLNGTMPDDGSRHYITTFHNDKKQNIQIMLSSSYRSYEKGNYYYSLKIEGPGGTYTGYRSANENYIIIDNADPGDYVISGKYESGYGETPLYNLVVLKEPKRLGPWNDNNSAAKNAGRMFIDNMSSSDQVGVVSFYTEGSTNRQLSLVNDTNKTLLFNAINGLNANGGTNAYTGIQKAIEGFDARGRSNSKHVAILLSDGYSQSPDKDLYWANQASERGITIYTIAMGMADEQTLGGIANRTGGRFYKVASELELYGTYADIGNDLKKVVANQTEMHVITNSSSVNGTLMPDTEYVPGSALVTYPNLTTVHQEPLINTGGKYELSWSPGTIKVNDTWKVEYRLKVLKSGLIEPIMNTSKLTFVREDGSIGTANFTTEMVYANGTEGGGLNNSTSRLSLKITYPASGSNATYPQQPIRWTVNYTGGYAYHQTLEMLGPIGQKALYDDKDHAYDEDKNATFEYGWDCGKLPDGDYTITVKADDEHGNSARDSVLLRIRYGYGRIILE